MAEQLTLGDTGQILEVGAPTIPAEAGFTLSVVTRLGEVSVAILGSVSEGTRDEYGIYWPRGGWRNGHI